MVDLIHQLKSEARVLHRQARERGPEALRRVRLLKEFRDTGDAAIAENILRRHCLAVLAREIGFDGWPHALAVLTGERWDDFGTILYPPRGAAYWNIWSASYAEAKSLREQTGRYLLAYRKHYFIVETYFIESLGLDPADPDWERIGRDWVRPADLAARSRLYARLIACNPLTRAA
jgi:hypothetical protein